MSDHNKALIRRFYDEAWNAGKVHVVLEIFADDYIRHDLRPTSPPPGAPGMRKIASDFPAEFLDLRMEVELMVAEDDLVAARWTSTGTNTGAWGGHPPTGKRATFSGVNIFRIRGGKVIEIWNHRDDLGLQQQLGAEIYAGAVPEGDASSG